MNRYKVKGHIGEGAHGYVMKAVDVNTNKEVALKKLLLKNLSEGIPANVIREIKALQHIDYEYVVQLFDVIPNGMGFILVMEYLPLGLWDVLRDPKYALEETHVKRYMNMLLLGVTYLHEQDIMHRDLKPANLLISYDGKLKIADLGLARIFASNERNRQYSHQVATRWYRAPELLYGSRNYTQSVDIWAVGCIFGEMINKSPLFPGETDIEQLAIVLRTLGTPSIDSWPNIKTLPDYNKISFPQYSGVPWHQIMPDCEPETIDFIKCFIQYNDKKRITAKDALVHPYFFTKPLICDMSDMPRPTTDSVKSPIADDLNFDDLAVILSV